MGGNQVAQLVQIGANKADDAKRVGGKEARIEFGAYLECANCSYSEVIDRSDD